MEKEISLEKVFRISLTQNRFLRKYLHTSFGSGGLSFNLELEAGKSITLVKYEPYTMIWFMGITQQFDNKIGEELIHLFDKTQHEGYDKKYWEIFLFEKFGEEILI